MNLRDWNSLPAAEFAELLRARQMTLPRYNELVAGMEADARMEAEMRAAGTLLQSLPAGMLGHPLSYGVPKLED